MSSPYKEFLNTPSSSSPSSIPPPELQRVNFARCNPQVVQEESVPLRREHFKELRRWYQTMMSQGHVPPDFNPTMFPRNLTPTHINLNDICPNNPLSLKNQQYTPVQDQTRYHSLLFRPKYPTKEYQDIWSDSYWLDYAARVIADNETDFIGKRSYERACFNAKVNFNKAVDVKTERLLRYFDEAVDLNEEPWTSTYVSTNDIGILFHEKAHKAELIKELRSAVARQLAFEEECERAGRNMADAMGVKYAGKEASIWSFQPPFLNPPWEHVSYVNARQNVNVFSRPSILQNDIMITIRKHEHWIICQGRNFYKQQCGVVNEIGKLVQFFPNCKDYMYCPRQELYRMRIEVSVEGMRVNEPPKGDKDNKYWGSACLFSSQKILDDATGLEVIGAERTGTKKCQMYATGKGLWTFSQPVGHEKDISSAEELVAEDSKCCDDDDQMLTPVNKDQVNSSFIGRATPDRTTSSSVPLHGVSQDTNQNSSLAGSVDRTLELDGEQNLIVLVGKTHDDISDNESDGDSVVSLVKFHG